MRQRLACWFLGCLMIALLAIAVPAQASDSRSVLVVDARTGAILHERGAELPHHPASLTKMMTLYLLFEALEAGDMSLNRRLPVSAAAAEQTPIKLGLKPGDRITVEEAIFAIVARSANDVAVVLAEALAGTEAAFARRMTQRARQLGMAETTFRNASGLPDDDQISSARDIAILAIALHRDFPKYYQYFATRQFRFKQQVYASHNRVLLNYPGADGLKTGYTRASGFNLASSAERGGRRVIGVVLGSRSAAERDEEMMDLLDRGFNALREPRPNFARAQIRPEPVVATPRQSTRARPVAAPRPQRPEAAPTEPVVADIGGAEDWGVQIGAYAREKVARSALDRASTAIAAVSEDPRPLISAVGRGERRVFRARLVGLTLAEANSACERLSQQRLPCQVVRHAG